MVAPPVMPPLMLFEHPTLDIDALILIEPQVVRELTRFRQTGSRSTEAGGILLGYRRDNHLHVVLSTRPGKRDQRSRYEFIRVDPSHQERAKDEWERTNGQMDYLGEWHTHPEPTPSPSAIDTREWLKLLRIANDELLFVIVGMRDFWVGVGRGQTIQSAVQAT